MKEREKNVKKIKLGEGHKSTHPRSSGNSKWYKVKNIHTKSYNQNTERQGKSFKSSKKKWEENKNGALQKKVIKHKRRQ